MRKYIVLLATFSLSSYFQAQKINLRWEGTEVVDYGHNKISYPKFTNKGYEANDNTVYININGQSQGKQYKISNQIWEEISSRDIGTLDPLFIPEIEQADVTYYLSHDKLGERYNARVSTLRRQDNQLYRLASFEIIENPSMLSDRKYVSRNATADNPLKSGSFFKIKVDRSGVFKITKKFLQDHGINVSEINPKNFRIYGNGGLALPEHNRDYRPVALQENAIQVVGEEDGVWHDEDYALFYAQGPHGFNIYQSGYNGYSRNSRIDTRNDRSMNFTNLYEDYAYYFINFDIGEGKRIADQDEAIPQDLFKRYDAYQFINQDKLNLLKMGRVWVDEAISENKTISFKTESPILPEDVIYYRTSIVAYQANGNSVAFDINGKNSYTQNIPNSGVSFYKSTAFSGNIEQLSGNEININISPNLANNPNGSIYFDYAEVLYKQELKYNGGQMNFRSYDIVEGGNERYGFELSHTTDMEQIWDVSDITNVKRKVNKSQETNIFKFGYNASSEIFNNEFVAFKNSAAYLPTFIGKIDSQNLSELQNIDYLILTRKNMMGEAQRLADYHTNKNQYRTAIVDIEQVYNEFSSGGQDITAIRDFVSKLKEENGGLKYVLLIGDTSYDYKDRIANNDNIVPSYQSEESGNYASSYVTDDYFVMTRPRQTGIYLSSIIPDLPIGRLPASNVSEAKLLIDKTLAYYNALEGQSSPFGEWRMNLDFVVDDDYEGGGPFHNVMNDAIKINFENGSDKKEYNVSKMYLDAYPATVSSAGQRFPQINQAISNAFNNSLYIFYFGHGGINGWAQERVLTSNEIKNLNNYSAVYSRFPLVSTITCEFTLWDRPDMFSAGEQVIKHKSGGAASMITSSRAIGVTYGRDFTKIFTNHIFQLLNNDFLTLGDAHLSAKKEKGPDSNHLRVNFLGDPAMKLSRPEQRIIIDKIESPVDGQFRALDFVTIKGKVTKTDGTLDENYNGKVVANIFDKPLSKTTLNNDNSSGLNPRLIFKEEKSPIVKSSGTVEKGEFNIQFYIPKDIDYQIGDGRVLLYAENFASAKSQAQDVYQNQSYKIGGINENGISDNEAPKVNLYMNNTHFADGGITNRHPNLLACITDNTGINSTGSGVGHDITVILDGEVVNTFVLNDFFSGGDGNGCIRTSFADYQKGNVVYPFKNLSPGPHQVVFKVWDINNNSTSSTLNFVVKDDGDTKLALNRLLNWPNPFTSKTYIHFEHNCDDLLDINVQIYTITGKLVKTINTIVSSEPFIQGYRTPRYAIEWDGKDDYGTPVAKGTYIYKVNARSQNQERCKGSASAIEKMVVLK